VGDIVEFLKARLDEDEAWARAANQAYPYADDEDKTLPDGGVHWRWVAGMAWDTVVPDPVTDPNGLVGFDQGHVNLATVEEWPTGSFGRTMPRTYANEIVEMDSSAAGHIIRHDPARVLRDIAAKRALLEAYGRNLTSEAWLTLSPHIYAMAAIWAEHPDYDPSWTVAD
jgi:hypothetical protein